MLSETWAHTVALFRDVGRVARLRWGWAIAALGLAVVVVVTFFPHDRAWLTAMHVFHGRTEEGAHALAWQLGRWGDFLTYNLPVALLIWIYGAASGSRAWRQAAIVCLLGATLAGLSDDCFRLTMGRPRPDVYPAVPDGFYGPARALFGRYQSFPSGHASTDIGMGVALLLVCRPLGALATAYALLVVWARMELNKHYPSDVTVGTIIGIYVGALVGSAGRKTAGRNVAP